ncbi:MAG: hypothetical protein ACK5P7_04405 [Bdellovibrio sp.]
MMHSKASLGLISFLLLATLGGFPLVARAETAPAGVSVKGKPRLVRGSPRTEVFFSDLPTSYWIDQDRHHNAFQKAFLEAAGKGKTLGFTVDEDNRKILSVEGVKTEPVRFEAEEILEVKTQK